jgi:transcriptional regulator with XRE-family HTH domain
LTVFTLKCEDWELASEELVLMPPSTNDPAVYRRRLRSELRKLREACHLSPRQVTQDMEWSPSKLSRIEAGTVTISPSDLKVLMDLYRVTEADKRAELQEMARLARQRSFWFERYRSIASPELLQLCGFEASALIVRNFDSRAILSRSRGARFVEELIQLRAQRQEALATTGSTTSFRFVIDEAALRRMVGGPAIMLRQLRHLKTVMSTSSNVMLQIVPFELGWYRGLRVPYMLFDFGDDTEMALYLENPDGDTVLVEEPHQPEGDSGVPTPNIHLEMFLELERYLSDEQTALLLDDAISKLEHESSPQPGVVDVRGGQALDGHAIGKEPGKSRKAQGTAD